MRFTSITAYSFYTNNYSDIMSGLPYCRKFNVPEHLSWRSGLSDVPGVVPGDIG